MRLEQTMIEQLKGIFAALENDYLLQVYAPKGMTEGQDLKEMIEDFVSSSERLEMKVLEEGQLRVELMKNGEATGVVFRGIPSGHEFTSLILAVYNADKKGKNLPDTALLNRVQQLAKPAKITTYVSLSCTNCPDVVQSLNVMALFSEGKIQHEMVDGSIYKDEVDALGIASVPAVCIDGKILHMGKSSFAELLSKLEAHLGRDASNQEKVIKEYDLVVVGGGPAGVTSAIYSARKGLNVAIVAERIGGQVNETVGIENIPSIVKTTGAQLADNLKTHVEDYSIDICEQRIVEKISQREDGKKVVLTSLNEEFITEQVIVATGATWRKLAVKGEEEYIGKGVAFCPHCDGPFFKGQDVAVVGGGNSGVEAAIDLAGICTKVSLFEYSDNLKADTVLQKKLRSLENVSIYTNVATDEILGDGKKVTGVRLKPHNGDAPIELALSGLFVQIGLVPKTDFVDGIVERNPRNEIVIDESCRTSAEGIYAAGDCSTVPYKQIVIAMGEGAKAALTAFDDRIRKKS